MKNNEQLTTYLQIISRIILHASSSFDVVKYIDDGGSYDTPAIRQEKVMSRFFLFVSANFYRITVLELCKLYNPNEDYSFKQLLEKIQEEPSSLSISQSTILYLTEELEKFNDLTSQLRKLRNKQYAHQDKKCDYIIGVDFDSIDLLISFAKEFFNKIYSEVTGANFLFDFPLATPIYDLRALMDSVEFRDKYYKDMEDNIEDFIK